MRASFLLVLCVFLSGLFEPSLACTSKVSVTNNVGAPVELVLDDGDQIVLKNAETRSFTLKHSPYPRSPNRLKVKANGHAFSIAIERRLHIHSISIGPGCDYTFNRDLDNGYLTGTEWTDPKSGTVAILKQRGHEVEFFTLDGIDKKRTRRKSDGNFRVGPSPDLSILDVSETKINSSGCLETVHSTYLRKYKS